MYRYLLFSMFFFILFGCDADVHTVIKPPAPKTWTAEDVDALVAMEEKSIYSPAPTENGQPPAACDYIRYLSLTPRTAYSSPDAILMLSPGMETGMGALSYLGKNLIYTAKTYHDANIEVLIAERRGNCLEDLTGVNAAEKMHDINVAVDYYYNSETIEGKVFDGFITNEQAPYLSEFGVKLNVEDIYTIITTEVPDQQVRRQKLFLGGHSISGFTLAIFAAWDFDGNPSTLEDAGYNNCAGFIALDTLISASTNQNQALFPLFPESQRSQQQAANKENGYKRAVANLRSGETSRIFSKTLLPESFMLTELAAMQSDWAPNEESTLLDTVPYSENTEAYLRLVLSGSYRERRDPESEFKKIRCTNLALSGLLFDNNFFPLPGWSLSMGFLSNGSVSEKRFPLPNMMKNFPQLLDMLQPIIPIDLHYPTDHETKVYRWINFDEFRRSNYTMPQEEVVDIYDYIKSVYSGPSNYYEWYFPNRHLVDILSVGEKGWLEYNENYQHPDFENKVPILKLYCEHGIITPYMDISTQDHILLEGYTHFDIILAAANRVSRRPNKVIDSMIAFMLPDNIQ